MTEDIKQILARKIYTQTTEELIENELELIENADVTEENSKNIVKKVNTQLSELFLNVQTSLENDNNEEGEEKVVVTIENLFKYITKISIAFYRGWKKERKLDE